MGKRFVALEDASRDEGDEKVATMSPKMALLVKYWEKLVENPLLSGKKTSSPGNENEMRDVERSCRSVRRRVHELFTTSEKKRQDVLTRQSTADRIEAARKVEVGLGGNERDDGEGHLGNCVSVRAQRLDQGGALHGMSM